MNSAVELGVLAAVCAVACGLAIALALRFGFAIRFAVDMPNERSLHEQPVPRVGGLVLVAVSGTATLLFVPVLRPLIFIALALAAVSAIDDRRGLPIGVRLIAHLAAAGAAAWLTFAGAPWWAIVSAFICIAWAINLYNFMDGSDGMAGGMALFGFGTYACVAALTGAYRGEDTQFDRRVHEAGATERRASMPPISSSSSA